MRARSRQKSCEGPHLKSQVRKRLCNERHDGIRDRAIRGGVVEWGRRGKWRIINKIKAKHGPWSTSPAYWRHSVGKGKHVSSRKQKNSERLVESFR